ncbi:Crp/Fnr family transcriptional regulator [Halomonas sp. HP20-15]|uniref:Crp/Fnr family transcriptional regulator n=1 Tax=Halomonas sp. HP20-15 TaxID=3085901 RepID=UPI002980B224|nr:Crp/Fnr family transcriptional regulator [Halomonas sp. HP20-15]MDW5377658.1 Crp/Fnr family transcriptional regulator [Halomonas sp. HP20-15]
MHRHESCILANLNRYLPLGDSDQQLLQELEKAPCHVTENQLLWSAGDKADQLYTIKSGWACTFRDHPDGGRQVVDVLLPGDVIGLRELTFAKHLSEARMICEGIVCPFPNHKIVDFIEESTPLMVALLASLARQESILTERMLIRANRDARSCIAHFIVETYTRLSRVRDTDIHSFSLPISQRILGEILGLTSVHISRSLTTLEKDRVLIKHRHHIEIIDPEKLFEEADFDGRYLSDDMNGLRERLKQHHQ